MTSTAERAGGTGGPDQSTADQAKEKVQETAQQVQHQAHQVKGQAADRVRQELDIRTTQAGSQLQSTAEAMRRTGEQLRDEGKEVPAKMVTAVAERAERFGNYMTDADADRMLHDVEGFARRQPLIFAFGGATLGFLASRFVKASSSSRYQRGNGGFESGSQSASGTASGSGHGYGELGVGNDTAGEYGATASSAPSPPARSEEPIADKTTGSKRGGSRGSAQ
jgi:hypothetical protein